MSTIPIQVVVPASAINGTEVLVRRMARKKTAYFKSTTSDTVYLEHSPDGVTWNRNPEHAFNGNPSERPMELDAYYVRAVRNSGTGGTLTLYLVGEELADPSDAAIAVDEYANPAAAAAAGLEAATASQVAPRVVTSFVAGGLLALAQHPRNITFTTAGATASDAPATATIEGTAVDGSAQSEVVNVSQTAATVSSAKLWSEPVSITYSAGDGTGATVSIGFGAKLGPTSLPAVRAGGLAIINEIAVGVRVTNGVFETPAVAPPFGSYTPNSAPDGTRDYAIYYERAA